MQRQITISHVGPRYATTPDNSKSTSVGSRTRRLVLQPLRRSIRCPRRFTSALTGVLTALGQYTVTLGNDANRPGLQFLSSEQLARYRGTVDSWAKLLIWLGLAVVWTIGAVLLTPTPAGR